MRRRGTLSISIEVLWVGRACAGLDVCREVPHTCE
jgi:hypothetical protein